MKLIPALLTLDLDELAKQLKAMAVDLGFQQLGITDIALGEHPDHLARWLADERHGEMSWMARNQHLRSRPDLLLPGAKRLLSARMNYRPDPANDTRLPDHSESAYVSLYARGRDYHKTLRKRLAKLAKWLQSAAPGTKVRACTDSAPVLEKAVAAKAGLGWIGKNTLLLNKQAGSWFFLGEILTDLSLPVDAPETGHHCGNCSACITICPTGAITGPGQLDSRRCISYLTIEHKSDIPEELRPALGNRIFGCDDCQLVCPWNRFAQPADVADFTPKGVFVGNSLLTLWGWSEEEFLAQTQGTAIRRISYEQWQRNLAVALGNAPPSPTIRTALNNRLDSASAMVKRHIIWALKHQSEPGPKSVKK